MGVNLRGSHQCNAHAASSVRSVVTLTGISARRTLRVSSAHRVWKGGGVLGRIVIDDVRPRTPSGTFPPKAAEGELVAVSADIFKDGHDLLAGRVRTCGPGGAWESWPMVDLGNDRWETTVRLVGVGRHQLVVEAWADRYATWRHDVEAKVGAAQDVTTELDEGVLLLDALVPHVPELRRPLVEEAAAALGRTTCTVDVRLNAGLDDAVAAALAGVAVPAEVTASEPLAIWVDRERALFSAWYELFPRSEGGFARAAKRLRAIAEMGFDVVYLPPIHPIGHTDRKGKNNTLDPGPDDVGSPWAIGSELGGHAAIHPDLGTRDDLRAFIDEASALGMEVALDYALQASPDHPWVREHPEWFHHRPDGTIKFAENPPKKYQDIYPINFWPAKEKDRVALWQACKAILDHWIDQGIRIFRVDNPHTKPMAFWAWLIPAIQNDHPDVLFLAEAFTRPKVMAKLAEVGFSQSYTYFTWRTTKWELAEYGREVSEGPTADYMRPNFWPNTPDILAGPLRNGSPAAFRLRAVLAATLVPSWGIYSGYELCENQPASDTNEEYLNAEKYELKERDWGGQLAGETLVDLLTELNRVRRDHAAFQRLRGLRFHHTNNDQLIAYSRSSDDGGDVVLCVVNLDPLHAQDDLLALDLDALGLRDGQAFDVYDELTGQLFAWQGPSAYVRLDPEQAPAHLLHVRPHPRGEVLERSDQHG
ncbi:MAG: alpha-1,4-glucan--maltose-1-phosphate maltosyltransferase [Acidobacteria bacterium]|nr:alpha-1,4-glucan--maltose-1-phosphate maltosyltransferase [Acidobacteriota bacterium]